MELLASGEFTGQKDKEIKIYNWHERENKSIYFDDRGIIIYFSSRKSIRSNIFVVSQIMKN
jgi:hypothetical protein